MAAIKQKLLPGYTSSVCREWPKMPVSMQLGKPSAMHSWHYSSQETKTHLRRTAEATAARAGRVAGHKAQTGT